MTDENWPRTTINPRLRTSKLNADDLALLDEMLSLSIMMSVIYCEREEG